MACKGGCGEGVGTMPRKGIYAEGVGAVAVLYGPFSLAWLFPSSSLPGFDSTNGVLRRTR